MLITTATTYHLPIQFLISEGKIWQRSEDTRTLWKQAALVLFLAASCSISAVTVCEWRGKAESELVSLHAFTSAASLQREKTSAATAQVIRGGGCSEHIKGWEEKQARVVGSISTASTRCSDWCPLWTSAVGATPGFHPQRPKAAADSRLHQEILWFRYMMLSLFLPDSHHIFSLALTLSF